MLALSIQAVFTEGPLYSGLMAVYRFLAVVVLSRLMAGAASPAIAAGRAHRPCLDKAEQRAAVAAHRAIRLSQALKSAHRHGYRGELLRARLCRRDGRLVYVLTLLTRSGKVTRTSVDARNGELIYER